MTFIKPFKVPLIITLVIVICGAGYWNKTRLDRAKHSGKLGKMNSSVLKELNEKYHEKFTLVKSGYQPRNKTYYFNVTTKSMPGRQFVVIKDLFNKGSFVSNFLQTRQAVESATLIESFFKGVAKDYKAVGGGGSVSPVLLPKDKKYLSEKALYNLHSKAMHLDEWIRTSHEAMIFAASIKINIKETPKNILKVLKRTYKLNKFLASKQFFIYSLNVKFIDLPSKPKFVKFPLTTAIFHKQQGWETDKYTWAKIYVANCTPNNIKKTCDGKPNVPPYSNAGENIKSPLDLAKHMRFIPRHSVKADIFGKIIDSWVVMRRSDSPDAKWMMETPMYEKVKALYLKDQKTNRK